MTKTSDANADRQTKAAPIQFGLMYFLVASLALFVWFVFIVRMGIQGAVIGVLVMVFAGSLIVIGYLRQKRIVGWMGAFVLICCVAAVCLPSFDNGAPQAARRTQCVNNLKLIILALQSYHDTYGSFPPAYVVHENGRPMHSWRVLILPFLEQDDLYDQYDFSEPWDEPNNSKLAARIPKVFQCPSNYNRGQSLMTSYVVVVGPETAWLGEKARTLGDMKDGTSNTILVVEVADSGIHWMEPRDFHVLQMSTTINSPAGQGISSKHPGGAQVGLADGSTSFVPEDWTPQTLKALLTIDGGETIDWTSANGPVVNKERANHTGN